MPSTCSPTSPPSQRRSGQQGSRPATARLTFGWRRAEILSALLNGATLIIVGGFPGYEAIRRLFDPPEISGSAVLITALVGVAVNLVATWLLAKANRASLNVEGAYQHVLTDLYAFIGTVIAGVVMITTGWARADSVASLFVCALMLRSEHLVRAAGWILLEATPKDYDLAEIRDHLMAIDGVVDVHDLHVWTVSDSLPLASGPRDRVRPLLHRRPRHRGVAQRPGVPARAFRRRALDLPGRTRDTGRAR